VSRLPNILLVHQKRFWVDYDDNFETKKTDYKMEFPFDLNMEPYTV